jgi:hypothetical protein
MWRLAGGTEHFTALVLDAKDCIFGKPHSAHVEHDVVAFVFCVLNSAHQRLGRRNERGIENFELHAPLVNCDGGNQGGCGQEFKN